MQIVSCYEEITKIVETKRIEYLPFYFNVKRKENNIWDIYAYFNDKLKWRYASNPHV